VAIALLGLGWGAWYVWRVRQRFHGPLERGQELLVQRRLDEAMASFELAREARPDDPAPLRGLAACYKAKGQLPEAAAWADRASALDASPASRVLAAEIALVAAGPWDPLADPRPDLTREERAQLRKAAELAQAAAESHPDCGPAHRALAEAMGRLGDVANALPHLRRALQIEPQARATRLTAGDLLILDGESHEALEHYRYVAGLLDPFGELEGQDRQDLLRALRLGGRVAAALKMGEQAIGFWGRFLTAGGDTAEGQVGLTIGNYVKGDYLQAIQEGNRAMRYIGPTNPSWEVHYYLGLSLIELKRYDSAVDELRKAATVRSSAAIQCLLGIALARDGDRAGARGALGDALALDPRHAAAREELVRLLEADGEVPRALEVLRRGVEATPKAREAHQLLADFCLRHGRDAEAEQALRALYALEPPTADATAQLAVFYLDRGDPERALPLAQEAMALEATSAGPAHLVARVEAALGRYEEAETHFAVALRLEPKRAAAYVDWAQMLGAAGDRAGTEEVYARARKAVPGATVVRCAYARFCMATGRVDEAVDELRRVLDADRQNLMARAALVEHFLARKSREAALAQAREAVDALPKSLGARRLLARVYRARGEWSNLLQVLRQISALPEGEATTWPELLAAQMHEGLYSVPLEAVKGAGPGQHGAQRSVDLMLAISRFYAGSKAEALAEVGRLASADRRDADAGFTLSLMQLAGGQPALSAPACREFALPDVALEAWTDLKQRRERDPDQAREIVRLLLHAYAYEQVGWHDTAAEAVESILKIAPDCLAACCMAPVLWERAGDRARAIARCELSLKDCKAFGYGRLLLGDLLLLDGQAERARAIYAECATGETAPFEARTKLALLATLAGDEQGAVEAWRAIVREQPRHVPASNNLAWLLATKAEPELAEAADNAQTASEVAPKDPAVLDTVGWVCHLRGEGRRALNVLEDAAKAAPYRAAVLFHLGMAYAQDHQIAKAVQALTSAVELAPREAVADRARQVLRDLRLQEGLPLGDTR